MFVALTAYKQAYGDCNVPSGWKDNPQLAQWCSRQRKIYKNSKLSPDRFRRLEDIGFVWDPFVANWEEMFAALLNYKQTHDDCNVPNEWEENPDLGQWGQRQRNVYKKDKLSPERIKRLEDIGFVWNRLDATWKEMFAVLSSYKQIHGDCNVPVEWLENPELGQWCYVQRRTFRKNKISAERIQRLEQLGFVWERLETRWDEMFAALSSYKQTYGNCNVSTTSKEFQKLGQWCSGQRKTYKENRLPPARVQRLEQLGFCMESVG